MDLALLDKEEALCLLGLVSRHENVLFDARQVACRVSGEEDGATTRSFGSESVGSLCHQGMCVRRRGDKGVDIARGVLGLGRRYEEEIRRSRGDDM
jgi:hypothetical protein